MHCIRAPYKVSQLDLCQMEQFPNGTVGLNISLTIPKVLNYIGIVVKTFYKYTTYRPFMIDWSIEYCQTARSRNLSPPSVVIMKIIEQSLPEYSYPCPQGNITYNTFWMFEPKYVLQSMPSGSYRMDIFIKDSADNDLIALQIFGAIRKQGLVG
uniref:MD-2-related lipid-recognition domain-containing protein n=1 Tax=Anopheles maculatus TaxID=74869 RepID=A0A182SDR9_9DIPT